MAKAPIKQATKAKAPVKSAPKAAAKPLMAKGGGAAKAQVAKTAAKALTSSTKSKGAGPLTKAQLLETLADTVQSPKKDVAAVLSELVAIAYRETKKKGEFTIPGLGKFVKQKRAARVGHNPKTGEKIKIAAKTVVKFRLAKAAKDAVA